MEQIKIKKVFQYYSVQTSEINENFKEIYHSTNLANCFIIAHAFESIGYLFKQEIEN
jgi:hypothetical protein